PPARGESAGPAATPVAGTAPQEPGEGLFVPRPPGPRGYVGAAACAECHEDQHATWHASFHRSMTQVLGAPGTILHADFNGVELEFNRERFTLGTDGRRYWADVVDLDEPPESRTAARFPMELVTGSHHMQVFWLPA